MRVISRITDSGNFWTRSESRGSSIARSARPPPPVGAMRLLSGAGRKRPAKTCRTSIKNADCHPRRGPPHVRAVLRFLARRCVHGHAHDREPSRRLPPRDRTLAHGDARGRPRDEPLGNDFRLPSEQSVGELSESHLHSGRRNPVCGHPSIGTAFVAALEGLVPHPDGSSIIYQELEIGVLPLELICEGGQVKKVIMTQGEPSLGAELKNTGPLAEALGVRVRDIGLKGLVPQVTATGIPSLQVPMRTLEVVRGLDPDLRALKGVMSKFGEKIVCYAFALEATAPDAAVHARGFAPDLGLEDPATGSAAGACGAYLAAHGKLPAPTFIVEQGMEIHHASRIEVTVETEAGQPKVIRVGGQSVPIIHGQLRLP